LNEDNSDPNGLIQAILASIETRWEKSDQDIPPLAVILNPIYKLAPFAKISFFTYAGVWALLRRVWMRFYSAEPPHALFLELKEYLANTGAYRDFPDWVSNIQRLAESKVRHFH
jgi:hypothetical protein